MKKTIYLIGLFLISFCAGWFAHDLYNTEIEIEQGIREGVLFQLDEEIRFKKQKIKEYENIINKYEQKTDNTNRKCD